MTVLSTRPGYSGEGYIRLGSGQRDTASYKFNAPTSAAFRLTIRGIASTRSTRQLVVNESSQGISFRAVESTRWTDDGNIEIIIKLQEGLNILSIRSSGSDFGSVEIDRLELTPVFEGSRFLNSSRQLRSLSTRS